MDALFNHKNTIASEKVSIVVESALPFAFGPVSTTFTQAPPPPLPQKLFTEVEVNLAAKAYTRAEAHDEKTIALKSELEESKKELTAAKGGVDRLGREQQLEATKKEHRQMKS